MEIQAAGLIPVFSKDREPKLKWDDLKEITLDKWIDVFASIDTAQWSWPRASNEDIVNYLKHSLTTFCCDGEKIKKTQAMMYVLLHEVTFCECILQSGQHFDGWHTDHRMRYDPNEMVVAYDQFVKELLEAFAAMQPASKKVFEDFISSIERINAGNRMTSIREFNALFKKPMEFRAYFARHREYDGLDEDVKNYKNPPDPTKIKDYGVGGMCWHQPVCTVIDGTKRISIEEKVFGDKIKKRMGLGHVPMSLIMKLFGVNFEQFCTELMPEAYEPLEIVLTITPHDVKGFGVSLLLREVDDSIVLQHVSSKKVPDHLVARQRVPSDPPKKAERNLLQQKLIGKKVGTFLGNLTSDDYSRIYAAKVTYFLHFMESYLPDTYVLGEILVELRYLVFLADRFRLTSYGESIVFPLVLPLEESTTTITDAKNPTLLHDPKVHNPVVPNSITINNKRRIQSITGPNQNGKSRFMDTLGIYQIAFQAGWPIFAKHAEMSPKTDLRIHYVRSGVGISGESRFSHECQRMSEVFSGMEGAYPLILVDEPYTGTNHNDGVLLLKELLQACSDEDISLFLTTHFYDLIDFVSGLKNGWNLHCAVTADGGFTYQIKDGSSTISNALVVAKNASVRFDQIKLIIQQKKLPL